MTNKELGGAIRATLKKEGYAPRDFSVRVRDCGYSTSAHVTIKNPEIRCANVENLLFKFGSIDRDERTGEILEGGNCYLFVDYADGIFDAPAQEMAATAEGILRETGECIRIFDGLYLCNRNGRTEIHQQNGVGSCWLQIGGFSLLSELCVAMYKYAKFGTIAP